MELFFVQQKAGKSEWYLLVQEINERLNIKNLFIQNKRVFLEASFN